MSFKRQFFSGVLGYIIISFFCFFYKQSYCYEILEDNPHKSMFTASLGLSLGFIDVDPNYLFEAVPSFQIQISRFLLDCTIYQSVGPSITDLTGTLFFYSFKDYVSEEKFEIQRRLESEGYNYKIYEDTYLNVPLTKGTSLGIRFGHWNVGQTVTTQKTELYGKDNFVLDGENVTKDGKLYLVRTSYLHH